MTRLRERIRSGELGTILHVEATMTFPNALALTADAWRAHRDETPCGGLTPMGVHAIDGMIDLCGTIDHVYCQSIRRAVTIDADDTTAMILRMSDGHVGLPRHDDRDRTRVQLPGVRLARLGAPRGRDARRGSLLGGAPDTPVRHLPLPAAEGRGGGLGGASPTTSRAPALEAFARAAAGGEPYPITVEEMVHGAAVTEAIVRSSASGQVEHVA